MQLHEDIELVIGDEWLITGTLLDENNQPLDLVQTVPVVWTLLDPDGMPIPGLDDVIVERPEPTSSGKLTITLPDTLTQTLNPGRYTDAVRAWIDGSPAQMWRGCILAAADPFNTD